MLTRITDSTSFVYLLGAYLIFGLGEGMLNPPITNTAVSGMPSSMAGVAAAIASTSRQFGSTLGVAVLGALAGGAVSGGVGAAGFSQATHSSWWIVVGIGALVVALGLLTTTGWARSTAERTAEAFKADTAAPAAREGAPEPELLAH
jgi:MFS family permease